MRSTRQTLSEIIDALLRRATLEAAIGTQAQIPIVHHSLQTFVFKYLMDFRIDGSHELCLLSLRPIEHYGCDRFRQPRII